MKAKLGILFALWFAAWPPAAFAQDFQTLEQAIINGRPATTAELYSTIAIVGEDPENGEISANCTGTLIAPRVVLTAAHCVLEEDPDTGEIFGQLDPSAMWVVVGSLQPESAPDEAFYEVLELVAHPDYPGDGNSDDATGLGQIHDVAVLLLSEEVQDLPPSRILRSNDFGRLSSGTSLLITGYGMTDLQLEDGGVLHLAQTAFERRNDSEMLAGAVDQPDTCMGDSGGPAYLLADGAYWLVGVTSRGREDSDAACGDGGLYSLAGAYLSWIEQASRGAYSASADYGWGSTQPPVYDDGSDDDDDGCNLSASLAHPHGSLPIWALGLVLLAFFAYLAHLSQLAVAVRTARCTPPRRRRS